MRVLLLDCEETWAGGERQVELLVHGLLNQGTEVHLAASPRGPLARRLEGLAPILPLSMHGDIDLVHALPSVVAYLRRHRIQVMDSHTAHTHALAFFVRTLAPRVSLVVHRHVDLLPKATLINRAFYLTGRVSRFVAVSKKISAVLREYGVPEARISLVRSAVDGALFSAVDRFQARSRMARRLGIAGRCPLVGAVGQLASYKDHLMLLTALRILRDQAVEFHCVIAGEGKLQSDLDSRITELGLRSTVTLLGFCDNVPELMSALDILAMPSRTEGLGLAVLEAFHARTAVVATAAGGIPEMVVHGRTGLLSPPGDAPAFAANLATAIFHPEMRRAWSAEALQLAGREFSLPSMIEGNLAVYRDVAPDSR